jgi:hypothetical protein
MRKHPLLAFATAVSTTTLTLFGSAGSVQATTTHPALSASSRPAGASPLHLTRRHRHRKHVVSTKKPARVGLVSHLWNDAVPKQSTATRHFVPLGGVWAQLRTCESGNNYAENTGNGYFGAYQFSLSTWESLGLSGLPSQASPEAQDSAARRLQAHAGWRSWPTCSWMLNLS